MSRDGPRSVAWAISSERQPGAFDDYRTSLADLYEVGGVAENGRIGFSSRTSAWVFGDSTIGRGRSVAQTMVRGPREIRCSGLEHVSLIVNAGRTTGDCDGRTLNGAPGSVQFRDLTRPSTGRVERIDVINLMVPRSTAPEWLLGRDIHGLSLDGDMAGGRLIAGHLATLTEVAADLSEAEGVAAIEAAFLIAERSLGRVIEMAPAHRAAVHRTVRQRAVQILDERLLDGRLDVGAVALAVGVSRSTLYRAFEVTGGVRAYVQGRRLDRALAALRRRQGRLPTIGEIAYAHGFASDAHFSRAFRARFGCAPGDIRPWSTVESKVLDGTHQGPDLAGTALHEVLLGWLRVGGAA